jgi:hypothetical protein
MNIKIAVLFLLVVSIFANADKLSKDLYFVKKINTDILVDGMLNDASWREANILTKEIKARWTSGITPHTRFQALWNDDFLYFAFYAEDNEIILVNSILREQDIGQEDRVELFFTTGTIDQPIIENSDSLPEYYGIEIDAKGRVLDFSAKYYRKFNSNWNMKGLEVVSYHDKNGYLIEGKISLSTLKDLDLINKNNEMSVGVFRGDFTKKSHENVRWISWIDPETSQPDFHVSKAFGRFLLVE